jgi:hypothetical protein
MPPTQLNSQCVQVAGDDFKSGQTKIKSVLVDYLVSAGIKVSSIVSYNHLGNNDGKNLSAPEQFRSKEISKSNVVDDMVLSNGLLCVVGKIDFPRYSSHIAFADTPRTSTPITLSSSSTCPTSATANGLWTSTPAKFSWGERTLSLCTTRAKTHCLRLLSSSTSASWQSCVSASRTCCAVQSSACSRMCSVCRVTSCSLCSYNTPDMPAGSFQKVRPRPRTRLHRSPRPRSSTPSIPSCPTCSKPPMYRHWRHFVRFTLTRAAGAGGHTRRQCARSAARVHRERVQGVRWAGSRELHGARAQVLQVTVVMLAQTIFAASGVYASFQV